MEKTKAEIYREIWLSITGRIELIDSVTEKNTGKVNYDIPERRYLQRLLNHCNNLLVQKESPMYYKKEKTKK